MRNSELVSERLTDEGREKGDERTLFEFKKKS